MLSESPFFKLFFHIFAAIIEALIVAGQQVFVYPPRRLQPPAMLATSSLHLSGQRCRQIACHPGTSVGVGRGDNHLAQIPLDVGRGDNHLAQNRGCTGVVHLLSLKSGDEVLSLSSRVWPSITIKQKNGSTQCSLLFVLNCMPQLLQHFTVNSRTYCFALGQKFYQENTLSVPEYGAHDLPC